MPDDPDQLHPATPDEIAETLSSAVSYDGRRGTLDGKPIHGIARTTTGRSQSITA
jgi:hypothetical protein